MSICKSDNPYDEGSIKIIIKNGEFNVSLSCEVKLSRENWEAFNFDEDSLRKFLKEDITSKIFANFELCKMENLQGFNKIFTYEGSKMVSAELY